MEQLEHETKWCILQVIIDLNYALRSSNPYHFESQAKVKLASKSIT